LGFMLDIGRGQVKRREILTRLRAALESGRSQEALAEFLDGAPKSCIYRGLLCPTIFLKRLKQVQRQE
jgi:hypothetical protein